MKDANVIAFYITNQSNVMILDAWGTDIYEFVADTATNGTQDCTLTGGYESNGISCATFSIPIDGEDECDRVLSAGLTVKCFLAYGPEDTWTNGYETASFFGLEL